MSPTFSGRDGAAPAVTVVELRRMLLSDTDVRMLDVRTPGEFAAGHLPGSVNIPLDQLSAVAGGLAPATTVVLVCQSGNRAITAHRVLVDAGCAHPSILAGGVNAWVAAGERTDSRDGRWTLERQVRFVAGLLVLTGIALSLLWAPARFFAGAVGAGLVFAAATNTCAMGLLLGKLPYNRGRSCDLDHAVATLTR